MASAYVDKYTSVRAQPTVAQAYLRPSGNKELTVANTTFTQADLRNMKTRRFTVPYLQAAGGSFIPSSMPTESENIVKVSPSPSGQKMAVIRAGEGKEKKGFAIDVWGDSGLLMSIPTDDNHGEIYKDEFFGTLAWSSDETRLLYCAEAKAKPSRTYWEPEPPTAPGKPTPEAGTEYDYRQDWGELFVGRICARLFVANLLTRKIEEVKSIPEDLCAGDAVWSPDGRTIVFTGFPVPDKRLGLIYCYNRRAGVYQIPYTPAPPSTPTATDASQTAEKTPEPTPPTCLTPDLFHARCPRFSPDGKKLVFFACAEVKTHSTCSAMYVREWEEGGKPRVLVDYVTAPPKSSEEFPGFYCHGMLYRCFSTDSRYVYVTSQWRSLNAVLRVDLESGKVERVAGQTDSYGQPDSSLGEPGSCTLLDVFNDGILASHSAPNSPSRVFYKAPGANGWIGVTNHAPEYEANNTWFVTQHAAKDSEMGFECIVMVPKGELPPSGWPLIVVAHGGPHSCYAADWKPSLAFLTAIGYAVCAVNYRGSTGFGRDYVEVLLGHVGTMDVTDVQSGAEEIIARISADPKRVGYWGGSHGGFLGGHLVGQFPDFYSAAVLHNPVINMVDMAVVSDIPDWIYAESGIPYQPYLRMEDVQAIYTKSPIANNLAGIKAAVLFKIGAKDRRVPPNQGLQMYHALKALGKTTKVYWYPEDSHPIDTLRCDADSWINIAKWFEAYLPA